ncbi:Chromosomal replication initiator, DnaA C-terminal [uncultured Caudovirales phage]|uniref:Chromosomal replication initiator, DnaA C-terminal n=1 Tax=uncultured Caudovirales phage TaxID=2100421 RepID=A0A6J7WZ71_9CAUD|nr:Chromosomal replication initiator, DnaA C-terminal [uncultured Caudovirales phage]
MQETTKDLCYWAAQLYHTDRVPSDIIYDRILNSKSRLKEVAQAKQLVGYILYNHLGFTLQQVAHELNLINHTTIIYWIDKIQVQLRTNRRMQYRYDYMKDVLRGEQKQIIRQASSISNKNELSEADMQFIKSNFNNGYSVSYYADVLRKNRQPVKTYLSFLLKEFSIFSAPKIDRFRASTIKSQSINY